jgi:hypothetical protein
MICFSGLNAACINAATLALVDAGVPMLDVVCACTAGILDKTPVIGELFSSGGGVGVNCLYCSHPADNLVYLNFCAPLPVHSHTHNLTYLLASRLEPHGTQRARWRIVGGRAPRVGQSGDARSRRWQAGGRRARSPPHACAAGVRIGVFSPLGFFSFGLRVPFSKFVYYHVIAMLSNIYGSRCGRIHGVVTAAIAAHATAQLQARGAISY